jgi:hypothetical protein
MRSIYWAIKSVILGALIMALSATPASASGKDKVMDEKAKVEMNKVEKDKDEKVVLHDKKVKDKLDVLHIKKLGIHGIDLLEDEDLLGEDLLEDILDEED